MSDFQVVSRLKARKMHRCEECGQRVQLGEIYVRVAGSYDGHMGTSKFCVVCDRVWQIAHQLRFWFLDETPIGELFNHIREEVCALDDDLRPTGILPQFAHLLTYDATRPERQPLRALEVQA